MEVTRGLRIDGLTHDDFFVRSQLLTLFSHSGDQGVDVTKAAMTAVDRYGWQDAFEWPHQFTDLGQDEQTVEWLLEQLTTTSSKKPSKTMRLDLAKWFSQAPVELVERSLERLKACFGENDSTHGYRRLSDSVEAAQERIQFASETDDQCLERLEQVFANCEKSSEFPDAEIRRAERLCERLAQSHDRERIAKLVMEWLKIDLQGEASIADWWAGIAIRVAGLLPLRSALSRLLEMLETDWDWWNEEIEYALLRMADDQVLSDLAVEFPKLDWHGRLYVSSTFEKACNPRMSGRIANLVQMEPDGLIACNLAHGLANSGTPEGMAKAEEVYDPDDLEHFTIAQTLYAFYRLLGRDDHPELRRWREEMQSQWERAQALKTQWE